MRWCAELGSLNGAQGFVRVVCSAYGATPRGSCNKTRLSEGFLEGSFVKLLLRRVLRRVLIRAFSKAKVLRRVLRRGGGVALKAATRPFAEQSTNPFVYTLLQNKLDPKL